MAKATFFYKVIDPETGAILGTRNSDRVYTHAVVRQHTQRQTSEGYKSVPAYWGSASYCGSPALAEKELRKIRSDQAKYGKQNPHLATDGKIIPLNVEVRS